MGVRSVERWRRAWRELGEASCRRDAREDLGSVKPRRPGRHGSWSVARLPTAVQTSGGRSLESRH
ncbi:hypothetical protein ACFV14_26980 [Streptomyces zaomyceticus]|uniref:hypothetical protein n=1 Tax=Streptomyces zaomyceticus TaxID=68286 RepID=UPI0036ABFEBD